MAGKSSSPTRDPSPFVGMNPSYTQGGWLKFVEEVLLQTLRGPLRAFGLVEIGPSLRTSRRCAFTACRASLGTDRRSVPRGSGASQSGCGAIRRCTCAVGGHTAGSPGFHQHDVSLGQTSRLRNVARYRPDAEQLHQTFERGEDPASLSAAWRASLGFDPLPEIAAWWETWWSRYGHIRIYPVQALLQTRDATTLDELRVALPHLQDAIVSTLTPEAALLRSRDRGTLLDDLARQGYMPKEVA